MKKLPIIICLMCVFSTFTFAQEAQLIDELGNLFCDDLLGRMDSVMVKLNESDKGSFVYVISYEGKYTKNIYNKNYKFLRKQLVFPQFGESIERQYTMMNHLRYRNMPREKFVFVNGGFRESYMVQFWIVPKGAKLPTVEPTLKTMKYSKGTPINICEGIG